MSTIRAAFVALVLVVLASPPAAASRSYSDYVESTENGIPLPAIDAYTAADTLMVTLGPGDTIVADLTYTDHSGVGLDDLDLVLFSPFYAPVDLVGPVERQDVNGAIAAASHYGDQRVGRSTCASPTAGSHHHFAGTHESFSKTLAPGAESGAYELDVSAFLLVDMVAPFHLTVTVLDASGADVTADRAGTQLGHVALINPYVYCDAGLTDP
ncbi:MAG: hypothetical protein ACYDCK_13645 [Thermoplasmatota archaeon]